MASQEQITIFNRELVRIHRERAARVGDAFGLLFDAVGELLVERLDDVKRGFKDVLVLGAADSALVNALRKRVSGIVAVTDLSHGMASRCRNENVSAIVADDEFLPFAPQSFDLVVGTPSLHWVNDLPEVLAQARRLLRQEGLFLGAMAGEATLRELRSCLMDAEISVSGGVSPRLSPTVEASTASALLQRAGFELPVADIETATLVYSDMLSLMRELRGMGEANAHMQMTKHFTKRGVMTEAARIYQKRFPHPDGGIIAMVDMVLMHGWQVATA